MPVVLLAFSTGPPIKRTGAPADGGLSCVACHVTFAPANSDKTGSVSISFDNATYTPGVAQTVHVTVKHPLAVRWGFQVTARQVASQTTMAGTFTPAPTAAPAVRVRCDTTPAKDAPCNGALEFAEHSNAPRTGAGVGQTFDVLWTPPATDVGDIIFYFAGNAANGDGSLNGDRIYTSARTISSSNACTTAGTRPTISGMVNGATSLPAWSSNSILTIYGANFAPTGFTRFITQGDTAPANAYPQQLSCVAVEINGTRVPITYVQANQINLQAPTLTQTGPATVTVVMNPGTSVENRSTALNITTQQAVSPSFFSFNGTSIAALSTTGAIVANPAVVSTGIFAKPGDTISLYGTGFGATSPPLASGAISSAASSVAAPVTVTLNGVAVPAANILYVGLSPGSISGLYQINLQIPAGTPDGDVALLTSIGGVTSPAGSTIPVKGGQ